MKIFKFLYCFLIFSFYCIISDSKNLPDSTIHFFKPILNYTCDIGRNFKGGIKPGNAYMGLIDAGLILHTDKLWKGGEFIFELMNTHGNKLSAEYIGDMQYVSNIERGNYSFLYQLHYTQRYSKGFVTIGVHDLNSEFVVSEYGSALTNSSFGIPGSFSLNFPVSVYPNCALAAIGSYQLNDLFTIRTGIYDGEANELDLEPYNLNLSIFGLMSITELEYNTQRSLNSKLKLGGYFLSNSFIDPADSLSSSKGNYGFYLIADQNLTNHTTRGIGVFGQVTYAPKEKNFVTLYSGLGLNLFSPFFKRKDDIFAFGLAYARLYNDSYECDFEINYCFSLNKYISIQPVLHYIVHPGADQDLNNAFAVFLRIGAGL